MPVHDGSLCTSGHETVDFKILREVNKTCRIINLVFKTADFDFLMDLLGRIPWRCTEEQMGERRAGLSSSTMRAGKRLFRGTVVVSILADIQNWMLQIGFIGKKFFSSSASAVYQ